MLGGAGVFASAWADWPMMGLELWGSSRLDPGRQQHLVLGAWFSINRHQCNHHTPCRSICRRFPSHSHNRIPHTHQPRLLFMPCHCVWPLLDEPSALSADGPRAEFSLIFFINAKCGQASRHADRLLLIDEPFLKGKSRLHDKCTLVVALAHPPPSLSEASALETVSASTLFTTVPISLLGLPAQAPDQKPHRSFCLHGLSSPFLIFASSPSSKSIRFTGGIPTWPNVLPSVPQPFKRTCLGNRYQAPSKSSQNWPIS